MNTILQITSLNLNLLQKCVWHTHNRYTAKQDINSNTNLGDCDNNYDVLNH